MFENIAAKYGFGRQHLDSRQIGFGQNIGPDIDTVAFAGIEMHEPDATGLQRGEEMGLR